MKIDSLFRWGSTSLNSALFGIIIYFKLFYNERYYANSYSTLLTFALTFTASILFFLIYFKTISDRSKKVKIYNKDSLSHNDKTTEFKVNALLNHLTKKNIPDNIKEEIIHRIEYSIEQIGEEGTLKNLITQYQICIENERFYERIAWQIGAIFVPVSLTLSGVGLTNQVPSVFPVISGFALFITWILLFDRFRTSIRLYRDCAKLIEGTLGLFSVSYVYDFLFEKYGSVIRVWPYLVTLSGFYFNFTIFTLL